MPDGCEVGNHAWEIGAAPGDAACIECGARSTWTRTDLASSKILKAQRGAGAGQALLQAILDRNATTLRTVEED